jgi:CRP/FNR family transcriptional regulator, anaerobic regulatory protein
MMDIHEPLLQLIAKKAKLTENDIMLCQKYFDPACLHKNQIVEAADRVPKYLYFIVSGFMRLYHFNEKGEEVTTHINCPPGFITAYTHFANQTKSEDILECITDCTVLRITKMNLEALTNTSSTLKDFSIWIFHQSLMYNENRSKELAILTAEQRYLKLIENYPDILQNVPLQHIASFLGMNPKSLSRIRKQMIR